MVFQALMTKPVHALAIVTFIAGVGAIMFSRGIAGFMAEDTSPFVWLGMAFVIIAVIPIIAVFRVPDPRFMTVMAVGLIMIGYGIWIG